jgi:membrane protein
MDVLDALYEPDRQRPWRRRYALSLALALFATVVLLAAVALTRLGPSVFGWFGAIVLLGALIAVIVRFAPSERRPWRAVTHGGAMTLVSWLVTSAVFGVYLRDLASYGSVFGNLATVMIALEYLYLSSAAFLVGLLLDRLMVKEASGHPRG